MSFQVQGLPMRIVIQCAFLGVFSFFIMACSGPTISTSVEPVEDVESEPEFKTIVIYPDNTSNRPAGTAQNEALGALFSVTLGDTIEFAAGTFNFDTTLVLSHKEGITIKGAGMRETILSFEHSATPEGFGMSHMKGITIEDLTVYDTPGFAVKISDSNHVTLRNMRTMWSSADGNMDPNVPSTLDVSCNGSNAIANGYSVHGPSSVIALPSYPENSGSYLDKNGLTRTYVVDETNGGYAIYPVLSKNVLIDNVVALGASDAGVYVGQSNDIIVKNSEALFNVAGYEIENSDRADVFNSVAHCNTAGFLVFDLPGISQFGEGTRIFDNYAGFNNQPNFAPGGIVGIVPKGVGMLQLGYDRVEFFGNIVEFNRTLGFVSASHELLEGKPEHPDLRMDLYPEGIHIHDNAFTTNGAFPALPTSSAYECQEGTGPELIPYVDGDLSDIAGDIIGGEVKIPCVITSINDSDPSMLPLLVQIKTLQAGDQYVGTGAHIVWDGMYDQSPNDCELAPEFQSIVDNTVAEDGKPLGKPDYGTTDQPTCRYNRYKFDFSNPSTPTRRHPMYWQCYPDADDLGGNSFSIDSRKFMNFVNTDPFTPPLVDIGAHDCEELFGVQLTPIPPAVVEPYSVGTGSGSAPTEAEIIEICEDYQGNSVNYDALQYNCPRLSHYNLFSDPSDPRKGFNGNGIKYELTTPLFSDYASKTRVLFLPAGQAATWVEGNLSSANATINFPVGTVIAKTFSFRDGNEEEVIETRLLVHRSGEDGSNFWEGLPYLWEKDSDGRRSDATLSISGAKVAVSWNYEDDDPEVGKTYIGSSDAYAVPHPNQCGSCHNNDDRQAGDAPIGPKVRLMNRPVDFGFGAVNQLENLCGSGRLVGCPNDLGVDAATLIATNAPRLPRFDVPGDSFNIPGLQNNNPGNDALHNVEVRARAWLETNCAHCHNPKGLASSTGAFFDIFRKVNLNHGICKLPTTAGSASDGRAYDIVPGSAADSIASFRIHTEDSSL